MQVWNLLAAGIFGDVLENVDIARFRSVEADLELVVKRLSAPFVRLPRVHTLH